MYSSLFFILLNVSFSCLMPTMWQSTWTCRRGKADPPSLPHCTSPAEAPPPAPEGPCNLPRPKETPVPPTLIGLTVEETGTTPWGERIQTTLYPSLTDDPPALTSTFPPPPYVTHDYPSLQAPSQKSTRPTAPPSDRPLKTQENPTLHYQYPIITIQNGPMDIIYDGPASEIGQEEDGDDDDGDDGTSPRRKNKGARNGRNGETRKEGRENLQEGPMT